MSNFTASTLQESDFVFVNPDHAGSSGDDTINGTAGYDVLYGNNGNDSIDGGAGNDVLKGGSGDDLLEGGDGNDLLDGGSGIDVLHGGAGNDGILWDAADILTASAIDGGLGTDTLMLLGANQTIDLTAINDTYIANIEMIDITGSGHNTLTLNNTDLSALSTTTDTLFVHGNAGDTVNLSGGWSDAGTTTINSILYHQYTLGGLTAYLDESMTKNVS